MKIVTTYVANDGTEFSERSDCLRHEAAYSALKKGLVLLDEDLNLMQWEANTLTDAASKADVILVADEQTLAAMEELRHVISYSMPHGVGCWYECGKWIEIGDIKRWVQKIASIWTEHFPQEEPGEELYENKKESDSV